MEADVTIVGAGLSGLTAGLLLQQSGAEVIILEKSNRPGGRMKTDQKEGFQLDHGFQIYLSAYPAGKRILDLDALDLKKLTPGALLLHNKRMYAVGDPQKAPGSIFSTLFAPVGGLGQKWKILQAKKKLLNKPVEEIWPQSPKNTVLAWQEDYGFGSEMINHFLAPFFQGIFFDRELSTDRKMFEFVFKMFAEGYASVPAAGMEAIPQQLAGKLKPGTLLCNQEVTLRRGKSVQTSDGSEYTGKVILYACPPAPPEQENWRSSTTVYLKTKYPPVRKAILAMLTDTDLWCNNMVVLSEVAKSYAPPDQSLIAVSSPDPIPGGKMESLPALIKKELTPWFKTSTWEHLDTFHIPFALPAQRYLPLGNGFNKLEDHVFTCGDHESYGSSNAAMESGERAAATILKLL